MMQRILLTAFLVLGAGPALASGRNAQLPSSGIVIHLFGPNAGIPEQATPALAKPAAPAVPAPVHSVPAPGASVSAVPAPASAVTPSDYPEPQLGTILHQMFITGDPDRGSGFSTGRQKGN